MPASQNQPLGRGRPTRPVVLAFTLVCVFAIAINAWVCDDAFITLRSAKNLVEGRGPVFNVGWRVQSFTHPGWMLLLALAWALTREAFWSTIALGLAVSGIAVGLALGRCRGWTGALVCATALSCSRAFVEYSTAGLENPLTHLVVVAGALILLHEHEGEARRRLLVAGLLVSAAFLARPDAVLLLAPLWVHFDRRARAAGLTVRQRLTAWLLGAAPALAWELFSILYYGALVPNTAVAKLAHGIPRVELVRRGFEYVWRAASSDPASFVLVIAAATLAWLPARAGTSSLRPLARGAAAYLIYVIAIGGDFMEGRFLTAIVLCGALALGQLRWSAPAALASCVLLLAVASFGSRHPLWPDAGKLAPRIEDGIADERSHYAASASALAWRPGRSLPDHPWRELGERGPDDGARVVVFSTMGYYGFHADPQRHVVDAFALADPLLAQLPPVRRVDWKAGHLPRVLPDGYLDTLAGDPSQIAIRDPAVAQLYATVERVHHGPIFARGRAAAIVDLLTGRARAQIDVRRFHLAELVRVDALELQRMREPLRFRDAGVEIVFRERPERISLALSPGQRYAIIYALGDAEVRRHELDVPGDVGGRPRSLELGLPPEQFNRVHVLPLTMHGKRSLEARLILPHDGRPLDAGKDPL